MFNVQPGGVVPDMELAEIPGHILPLEEGFFRNVIETLSIPTFFVDAAIRIINANSAFLRLA